MRSIFPSKLDIPGTNASFCKPFFNAESRYYYGMYEYGYREMRNNSEIFFS